MRPGAAGKGRRRLGTERLKAGVDERVEGGVGLTAIWRVSGRLTLTTCCRGLTLPKKPGLPVPLSTPEQQPGGPKRGTTPEP